MRNDFPEAAAAAALERAALRLNVVVDDAVISAVDDTVVVEVAGEVSGGVRHRAGRGL